MAGIVSIIFKTLDRIMLELQTFTPVVKTVRSKEKEVTTRTLSLMAKECNIRDATGRLDLNQTEKLLEDNRNRLIEYLFLLFKTNLEATGQLTSVQRVIGAKMHFNTPFEKLKWVLSIIYHFDIDDIFPKDYAHPVSDRDGNFIGLKKKSADQIFQTQEASLKPAYEDEQGET